MLEARNTVPLAIHYDSTSVSIIIVVVVIIIVVIIVIHRHVSFLHLPPILVNTIISVDVDVRYEAQTQESYCREVVLVEKCVRCWGVRGQRPLGRRLGVIDAPQPVGSDDGFRIDVARDQTGSPHRSHPGLSSRSPQGRPPG